jgi:predicted SAM-dependent methyltransferase
MLRLNLGAGGQPIPQWTNVDAFEGPGIDEIVNLNGPWPWADGSVDYIFTSHCVEHLDDVCHFMKEAHRVMKKGARMEIRVPHGWNTAAWGDPTHRRPFYPETFSSFCDGYGMKQSFNLQHHTVRWNFSFEIVRTELIFQTWLTKFPFWTHYALFLSNYLLNIIREIRVFIVKN